MSGSGVWPVAQGVAWRTIKNVVTTPSILLPSLLFPLFMFTAFAGGLSQVQDLPGFEFEDGYTAFQFVFVLLQSAAFGGVFTGFGSPGLRGGPRRCPASPRRSGIVLGYAIAASAGRSSRRGHVVALVAAWGSGDPIELVACTRWPCSSTSAASCGPPGSRCASAPGRPLMQMPVFILFRPRHVPLDLLRRDAPWRFSTCSRTPEGAAFISEPEKVAPAFSLPPHSPGVVPGFRGLRRAEAAG